MPFRNFVSGEVLTSSNVMTYLANQTVITCATVASRPTSPTTGMLVYIQDIKQLQVYDGSAWQQIYPVVSDGITNGTVATVDLANGAVTGDKIASSTITNSNMISGGTYSINVTGNAATASNAALLDGYDTDTLANPLTIALRNTYGNVATKDLDLYGGTVNVPSAGNTYFSVYDSTGVFGTMMRVRYDGIYNTQITSGGRNVQVNSSGTLGYTTSSERYKENIAPLTVDTDKVLAIEPVSFRYKADLTDDGKPSATDYGVIAEQVEQLGDMDPLIYRDAKGQIDGFAYEKLTVLLLKVCRDQQAQIDALTERVAALEGGR